MKKITLTNPEEAQVLFHLNEWLYLPSYSIHGIKIDEEVCIVNANEFNSKVIAEEIKVILGAYEYLIKLDDFPNEVNISFKDVTDIGALLEINYEPYFLRVYNNANEQNLNEIVEKLPRLKIIDFGSGKNESIKSLHTFTSCVELIEINLANCKQLIDISDIVHFKYLQRLNIDGFQDELQLKTINSLDYIQKISNKRNAKISLKNVEQANNIFQVFTAHDNDYSFYIKAVHFDESESTILDLNEFTEETVGTHIFVKIGFELEYKFDLKEYGDSIKIELKNYKDCGITIEFNNIPVLFHLINKKEGSSGSIGNNQLVKDEQWISVLFEEVKNLKTLQVFSMPSWDYGTITNVDFLTCFEALETINISNCRITDIAGLLSCKNLKSLIFDGAQDENQLKEILQHTNLEYLSIKASPLINLDAICKQQNIEFLDVTHSENLIDINGLKYLKKIKKIDLSFTSIKDLKVLSELDNLEELNISYCRNISNLDDLVKVKKLKILTALELTKLVKVKNLNKCSQLWFAHFVGCSNIRDFESLKELPALRYLYHDDYVQCSFILMGCSYKSKDYYYINKNIQSWSESIELSKYSIEYVGTLLNCLKYTVKPKRKKILQSVSDLVRTRGLQSDEQNDLDAYTWETWCNLALELDKADAIACLQAAVNELAIERETEVILGPVIIASSELIERHPEEKEPLLKWVNQQLDQLDHYPQEQRQIAPSAAVFFASLNKKEEVLFWLQKATNEKVPLWREKVLLALVNYYAGQTDYTEALRLLDEMQMQEEKDKAIAALAKFMAATHPIDAGFLLNDIHEETISTEAARSMLQQPAMLREPQAIYQLLLHLQSNPDELASTLETMISKDTDGQLAAAVKQLFLQPQTAGPSATVLLELCKHPSILDFVKPRALEKYKAQLQERALQELSTMVPNLISEMQEEDMIDGEEALELTQLMQHK